MGLKKKKSEAEQVILIKYFFTSLLLEWGVCQMPPDQTLENTNSNSMNDISVCVLYFLSDRHESVV